MPFVNVNHQQIFYAHYPGSTTRPALLLVHGAGASHSLWPEELQYLLDVPICALDLPGHGNSEEPGRDDIEAYADDVQTFLEELNLTEVVIIGHSMGGAIALILALRHLPQLRGVVLIGTGARLRVAPAILSNILSDFEATVDTIMAYAWSAEADRAWVGRGRQVMLETGPQVLFADYTACDNFDVMSRLREVDLPALVLTGTVDQLTPLKYGQYLTDNIRQARLVALKGGGHFLTQEQPQRVAAEIEKFLAQCQPEVY